MNHHRIQRILHLVRDARRQSSECNELPRIRERRLHPRQIREIPRHQQYADELAVGPLNHIRHQQRIVARLHRTARGARCECLLDDGSIRVAVGKQPSQRAADGVGGELRLHCRIAEQQLARRVEERDGVLEVFDRRLQVRLLSRQECAVR